MEAWYNISFYGFHAILVFAVVAIYLMVFVRYTRSLEERILSESRIDFLTKTHNRYDLYSNLDSITEKKEYSLAIFDIDDLKKINDVYGHICGDYILKELAFIASNTLGDSFVSRYGGEELIIIAKENNKEVYERLEDLRKYIASHVFQFNDTKINITITIGVGIYDENMCIEAWIDDADNKLYQGKNSGKNKTVM
jgi:diguanylate cyclase (GGDEF)-like protein